MYVGLENKTACIHVIRTVSNSFKFVFFLQDGSVPPLHAALTAALSKKPDDEPAREALTKIVEKLLAVNASVSTRTKEGKNALHLAAKTRIVSAALFKTLLSAFTGDSLDAVDQELGNTVLHYAVSCAKTYDCCVNRGEFVSILVSAGAQPDPKNKEGITPLFLAAENGQDEAAKLLIEAGANKDLATPDSTILTQAVYGGSKELVDFLFDTGINTSIQPTDSYYAWGSNPLSMALSLDDFQRKSYCGCDSMTMFNTLIEKGINASIYPGALQRAINGKNSQAAVKLVAAGADMFARESSGYSPIYQQAVDAEMWDVIDAFLDQHGSSLSSEQKGSLLVSAQESSPSVVRKLIDLGNIQFTGDQELIVPSLVEQRGKLNESQLETLKMLIDAGAPVDIQDRYGYTPLFTVSSKGDVKSLKLLIHGGANVNFQLKEDVGRVQAGSSPLHFAALNNQPGATAELLNQGASVDVVTTDSLQTPLHFAVENSATGVVVELIKGGAKVTAQNSNYATPFDLAEKGPSTLIRRAYEALNSRQPLNGDDTIKEQLRSQLGLNAVQRSDIEAIVTELQRLRTIQ